MIKIEKQDPYYDHPEYKLTHSRRGCKTTIDGCAIRYNHREYRTKPFCLIQILVIIATIIGLGLPAISQTIREAFIGRKTVKINVDVTAEYKASKELDKAAEKYLRGLSSALQQATTALEEVNRRRQAATTPNHGQQTS